MISILFVCLANICRSPALEATLRHLAVKRKVADRLFIDSCGLGWYHLGEHPDRHTFEAAKARGILIDHRAQQFQEYHFEQFDGIYAVDEDIVRTLKNMARSESERRKVHLATQFSTRFKGQSIPDPYYMSQNGCADVMEIIVDSCEGLLQHLMEKK